jgi:hypothetical protein
MTAEEFAFKNNQLRHAIQTGIAYEYEINGIEHTKHLRVGINSNMCEVSSLCRILVDKGLITWEEIFDSSIKELEQEVKRYEERLSKHYGAKITLG